jgi:S-disulfanyl-L-cysteine oxidoreductase SoxD
MKSDTPPGLRYARASSGLARRRRRSPCDRPPGLSTRRRRGSRAIPLLLAAAALVLAQSARSVWDGVYTEDQAKRGAGVYTKECASCHGADLNGGESAPPLVGGTFLSNWNTLTVGDLFERIRESMPQDNPGRLSRQQDADVLAFMLQANEFPTGKTELDKQTEVLKLIGFKKK